MDFNIASYIHHNRLSRCSREVSSSFAHERAKHNRFKFQYTCTNRPSFIFNILFRYFTLISVHMMSIPLITTDSFIRLKTIKRLLQYGNSLFENKFTTSSTDVFASIFELEMSS